MPLLSTVLSYLKNWLHSSTSMPQEVPIPDPNCESCIQVLSWEDERAKRFHVAHPEICGCEKYSLTAGKVHDDETLHFIVSDPDGIINGFLSPTLAMQIDSGGLSTLRSSAADGEFIQTLRELRSRWGGARQFIAVQKISVKNVRYHETGRLCCVYDTALPGKPKHADIIGPDIEALEGDVPLSKSQLKKQQKRRIRQFIEKAGSDFESPAGFRNGLLAGLDDAA